jgi:hypothetical protein
MTTPMSKWNLGDAAKAIGTGAAMGAAGAFLGAMGGKLIATFGSKILGPVLDSVASRLGPAALDDAAADVADEAANVADEAAGNAANDASHAAEPHGGGGGGGEADPAGGAGSEPSGGSASEPQGGSASEPQGGSESQPQGGTESGGSKCTTPHSFDPTTPVLMANGTTKPIGTVALGDQVESTDPTTGETVTEPVVALHDNHDTDLADVTIQTSDGRTTTLHTTWHHPFWNETDHTWTDAAQLTPGKVLHALATSGRTYVARVIAVKTWTGLNHMRDLTVANVHTYYVVAGATPVLVHNQNILYNCTYDPETCTWSCVAAPGGHAIGDQIAEGAGETGEKVGNAVDGTDTLVTVAKEFGLPHVPEGSNPDGSPGGLVVCLVIGAVVGGKAIWRVLHPSTPDPETPFTLPDSESPNGGCE